MLNLTPNPQKCICHAHCVQRANYPCQPAQCCNRYADIVYDHTMPGCQLVTGDTHVYSRVIL